MNPKLPRFWYLWPISLILLVALGLTIAFTGITVHDAWSTTGITIFDTTHAQYLGYVDNTDDFSRPHMITNSVAFHKYDDEHLSYEFTFVPPFSIMDHQLVTARSISFDTKVNYYFTLSVVYPVGPVVKNVFIFSPIDQSADTVVYNFDKIVVKAGWHAIEVYKGSEVTTFKEGYWGYINFSDQPITVLMDWTKYETKGGFGGVCTDYNPETNTMNMDVCPYVYQEFEPIGHEFYFVEYPKTDEADIVVTP